MASLHLANPPALSRDHHQYSRSMAPPCLKKKKTTTTTTAPTVVEREESRKSEDARSVSMVAEEESGRERLKRHRSEMAGRAWSIPEEWGHERLLEDWKDCSLVDRSLFPAGLLTARDALVEECRRAPSTRGVRPANS